MDLTIFHSINHHSRFCHVAQLTALFVFVGIGVPAHAATNVNSGCNAVTVPLDDTELQCNKGLGAFSSANGSGSTTTSIYTEALALNETSMGPDSQYKSSGFDNTSVTSALVNTAISYAAQPSERSTSTMATSLTSSAIQSTAIGFQSEASGNYSTAIGRRAQALGNSSTAIGRSAIAEGANAFAGGTGANAQGTRSTAIGIFSNAMGARSIAIGDGATASPTFSTAIGYNAVASGSNNIAIGSGLANYTLAGLAGTGTRILLIQPDGTLVAGVNLSTPPPPPSGFSNFRSNTTEIAEERLLAQATTKIATESAELQPDIASQLARLFAFAKEVDDKLAAAAIERSVLAEQIKELKAQLDTSLTTENVSHREAPVVEVNITTLEKAGLEGYQAQELIKLGEQAEQQALELRHTATREGWLISDKYRMESTRLQTTENPLRKALGDAGFAEYLENSDQSLRIEIESVFSDSAAQRAGLQAGDEITHYAGSNIFSLAELQMNSESDQRQEQIAITVLRGGELMQLFIERGPLGVRAREILEKTALATKDWTL